jgi:methylmalonyl-CoA/ethylmalonyl-CoA epimerase
MHLPLSLGPLDHYTLIVEDAAAAARFHCEALGFTPLRVQLVNAGSAPEGGHDMLNHVLQVPGSARQVMVVTEGLTDESIFRRYLRAHGPGVHHVAFEVEDLDGALRRLHAAGVRTTSPEVLRDPLTGLRQVFVDRAHGGYFVELIERTPAAAEGAFTDRNMAALARTMLAYLEAPAAGAPAVPRASLARPRAEVAAFVADPLNLPRWTGHRTVRRVDGRVVEVRMAGDVPIEVEDDGETVRFTWRLGDARLDVRLRVTPEGDGAAIEALLPELPPDRAERTRRVIQAELDTLAALFAGREPAEADRRLIDAYHLEVYQRRGL